MTRRRSLIASADQAFLAAMGSTMDVASAVALAGALIALVFLPAPEAKRDRRRDRGGLDRAGAGGAASRSWCERRLGRVGIARPSLP